MKRSKEEEEVLFKEIFNGISDVVMEFISGKDPVVNKHGFFMDTNKSELAINAGVSVIVNVFASSFMYSPESEWAVGKELAIKNFEHACDLARKRTISVANGD